MNPATRADRIAAAQADLEAERAASAEQDRQAREYLAQGGGVQGAPSKGAAGQAARERLERVYAAHWRSSLTWADP